MSLSPRLSFSGCDIKSHGRGRSSLFSRGRARELMSLNDGKRYDRLSELSDWPLISIDLRSSPWWISWQPLTLQTHRVWRAIEALSEDCRRAARKKRMRSLRPSFSPSHSTLTLCPFDITPPPTPPLHHPPSIAPLSILDVRKIIKKFSLGSPWISIKVN